MRVQEKVWMDARSMIDWLELCVRPFTECKPAMLVPDSFRGHVIKEVNASMRKSIVIPSGWTTMLQSLDVSIKKTMKDHTRLLWQ